jgi:four helix bundle protein
MISERSLDNFSVWHDSISFVRDIYVLTNVFPEEEKQGLVKRLRDAAIDISSKISKSLSNLKARKEDNFLKEALDHINEIETFLIISQELSFINKNDLEKFKEKTDGIGLQIHNLSKKLNRDKEIREAQNKY